MCPKSLQYAAQTNISPDAEFNEEIKAIKQMPEQAYICALTKFNYRLLKKKTKLKKSRQAPTKSKGFYKPYNEKKQTAPHSTSRQRCKSHQ